MKEAFDLIRKKLEGIWRLQIRNGNVRRTFYIPLQDALSIVSEVEAEYEQQDHTDYANIELYAFWNKHQWIPCSERLPEKHGRYLVCNDGVAWIADFFNSTWFGKRCRYSDVIAWMPLPEPYKPDESEI